MDPFTTLTAAAGAGTCTLTATSPATSAYSAGRQVNTIALARGKKEFDKRQSLREEQDKREALRAMRYANKQVR